jgi:FMN phosphatase YigB (HAD superfamily)
VLYSFDIFDTILYRTVPNSIDIFLLMEEKSKVKTLWKSDESFAEARRKAEFWLRRKTTTEISIEEIYKNIGQKYNLSSDVQEQLIKLELETEKENSFLHTKAVNKIKDLFNRGEQVILLSDMYWHENEVRDLLASKDSIFSEIPIYVSCDHGATKKNRKLYEIVSKKLSVRYADWKHYGDNVKSDYKNAKSLGIQAVHTKQPQRYHYEKHLPLSIQGKAFYGLITQVRERSNGPEYDLGASFAAPMVYQYVLWVIKQANAKNINKLYFVLRDGYILKKVADVIIQNRGLSISTEYLFGSRVAWRFPEVTIDSLKQLSVWDKSNWIFRDPAYAYVPFERMGFETEELASILGKDFCEKEYHSFADFKAELDEALANPTFCERLEEKIKVAGENMSTYLVQALDENSNYALVDTNSTGKTQKDLDRYIESHNLPIRKLRFFYHTFLSDQKADPETQFVFLDAKEQDRRFPEALFRAPYNPCYGYEKDGDKVKPKFFKGKYCAWNYSFSYDNYLKGIVDFTDAIEKSEREYDLDSYVDVLMKVANFDIVSDDEVQQVARLPFNPDMHGEEILDFYPEIHAKNLTHPFTELIYYPKGSYFRAGGVWPGIYKVLDEMVKLKRKSKK